MGKPGFPIPPPAEGSGSFFRIRKRSEAHASARRRVWEGAALEQGDGETRFPHSPTWWEGLGGRSPPRNHLFHPVGCGVAARTMERQSTIRNLNSKMVNDTHMPVAWANIAMRCPFNGACPRVCVVSVGVAHRCGGNYTEFSAPGKPPDQAVLPAHASLPGAALPASPQPSMRLRRTLTGGKEVVPAGRGSPTPSTRAGVWRNRVSPYLLSEGLCSRETVMRMAHNAR